MIVSVLVFFFFFNDTATTEIYTLSLHDALPICAHTPRQGAHQSRRHRGARHPARRGDSAAAILRTVHAVEYPDRKSTRLNSSHSQISYAVFCLKKKKNKTITY